MNWNEEMGNRINECLGRKGWNQTDLAAEMNVSPHTVSRWVCGVRMPTTWHLREITKLLDTSADYLLFGGES